LTGTASGIAKSRLGGDGQTFDYQINVTNINTVMGAHIHFGKLGQDGPVIAALFNPNEQSSYRQGKRIISKGKHNIK
jgi:hypothetical protein